MAFQAKFSYESNDAALQVGKFRRQIASLLTIHRFGKDLVAPVTDID
jgi:ribosomal protein L29